MAVNKVIYNGEVLMDSTETTVTPETLALGVTALDASGEVIEGQADFSNCGITYIESPDADNPVILRELESGTYVFNGKFRPYTGSTRTLSFSSKLLVNVITKTAGTHVQIFYPLNNCVQFLDITDESYTPTYVYLNDLQNMLQGFETDPGSVKTYIDNAVGGCAKPEDIPTTEELVTAVIEALPNWEVEAV